MTTDDEQQLPWSWALTWSEGSVLEHTMSGRAEDHTMVLSTMAGAFDVLTELWYSSDSEEYLVPIAQQPAAQLGPEIIRDLWRFRITWAERPGFTHQIQEHALTGEQAWTGICEAAEILADCREISRQVQAHRSGGPRPLDPA